MVELILHKRRARRIGEIGLFVNAEVFEDLFARIKMDQDVTVKATVKRSQQQMAFSWVIANLLCHASDGQYRDPESARDALLIEAGHFKRTFDHIRNRSTLYPLPTSDLDGTEFLALLRKMVDAIPIFLPHLADSEAKRELERVIAPDLTPEGGDANKGGEFDTETTTHTKSVKRSTPEIRSGVEHVPGRIVTNVEEYVAAARHWMRTFESSHEAAIAIFRGEKNIALRKKLNISTGTTRMLERELAEHFNTKEST